MVDRRKRALRAAGVALFYLAVWQLISMAVGNDLLLPGPKATVQSLFALAATEEFYLSALFTLLRVAAGFVCGVLAGTVLGVLTASLPAAAALLGPLRGIVKATPVTSFIILVLLWMTSSTAAAFIAFLMVLPVVWTNVHEAVLSTDEKLIEMGRVFKLSLYKRIRYIYAPSVLAQFLAACSTGLGFAWKAGVTAEVLAMPGLSIGRSLRESKLYVDTPALFAWTAVVVILSIALEKAVLALARRVKG